ncbi:membrane-associated protein, putative [Bodo saltans]|uniref:Membrane-associated protein, putative n=1 Tax=Bodo saltans TaxID=75058 RepID=A0A0S4J4S3_BODSA|nr:membrane-associated protein, putative [Bodo saltans]|eukprot:CUG51610.1 membrane-associated protein, putative [Bodo saltans]
MFRAAPRRLFQSHSTAPPVGTGKDGKETITDKVKNEIKKMLKIQIVLIPVACVLLFWLFPPPSPEEERRLRMEYEKNAGWKT